MFKNEAINEKEMTLIIANLLSVKAIFAFPGTIVETSGKCEEGSGMLSADAETFPEEKPIRSRKTGY